MAHNTAQRGWLHALLGEKRSRVAEILSEIAAMGMPGFLKPAAFRRFLELLSQLSYEKNREARVIDRIEAMESHHHRLRKMHRLEHANPANEPQPPRHDDDVVDESGEKRSWKHNGMMRWFRVLLKSEGATPKQEPR